MPSNSVCASFHGFDPHGIAGELDVGPSQVSGLFRGPSSLQVQQDSDRKKEFWIRNEEGTDGRHERRLVDSRRITVQAGQLIDLGRIQLALAASNEMSTERLVKRQPPLGPHDVL